MPPFQFTPLREGRRASDGQCAISADFNSRPSARGDPPPRPPSGACCYFNSRPSARGDLTSKGMQEKLAISIHAPPRGATCFPICWNCCRTFQFTPLREGRRRAGRAAGAPRYFNSRPSARGDSKRYAISANLLSNPHKLPRFSSRAM